MSKMTKIVRTYEEGLLHKRTQNRRKITSIIKKIDTVIGEKGSRTFLKEIVAMLEEYSKSCERVNEEIVDNYAEDDEYAAQWERQLEYRKEAKEALERASSYLEERADEAASIRPAEDHCRRRPRRRHQAQPTT